ncbi:MGAP protein, partial [Turnix velox]|nr:MGAP protein [Turnix velox]
EAEAFAHYRLTHTANERRRRNEMRDLFEKLKGALRLSNRLKVSKSYILKQAFEEIQGLTDQADKLIGQKNLLSRKQDILIRKVSTLSGKTEEVVLKKLEYIYAKQKAQKKKKPTEPEEPVVTSTASTQQEAPPALSRDLTQIPMTNRRGKPLILTRKSRVTEDTSSPLTLTAANLVMTPQGQVLTLKNPLVPGQVAAVPSALLQAELKPRAVANTMTAQPESEDSFMMPRIVNVTSLAAEVSG